jgi:hypothetical protein
MRSAASSRMVFAKNQGNDLSEQDLETNFHFVFFLLETTIFIIERFDFFLLLQECSPKPQDNSLVCAWTTSAAGNQYFGWIISDDKMMGLLKTCAVNRLIKSSRIKV